MRNQILFITLFSISVSTIANAQIHFPPRFEQLLNTVRLDCVIPLENNYQEIPINTAFQKYDFAIASRQEDLEIRYFLLPYDSANLLFIAPHIEASRLAFHLATNEEDIAITVLSLEKFELQEKFNADWGAVFYFKPKASFSEYAHCKMLTINAEGKGMAFVFFLFDEPSRELDYRFEAVRFRENDNN
jgi:hypothetical protein